MVAVGVRGLRGEVIRGIGVLCCELADGNCFNSRNYRSKALRSVIKGGKQRRRLKSDDVHGETVGVILGQPLGTLPTPSIYEPRGVEAPKLSLADATLRGTSGPTGSLYTWAEQLARIVSVRGRRTELWR